VGDTRFRDRADHFAVVRIKDLDDLRAPDLFSADAQRFMTNRQRRSNLHDGVHADSSDNRQLKYCGRKGPMRSATLPESLSPPFRRALFSARQLAISPAPTRRAQGATRQSLPGLAQDHAARRTGAANRTTHESHACRPGDVPIAVKGVMRVLSLENREG